MSKKMKKLTGEWIEYKEQFVQCSINNCDSWTSVRVKIEKDVDNCEFVCGFCAYDEVKSLKAKLIESDSKMKDVSVDVENKVKEMTESVTEEKTKWSEVVRKNNAAATKNAVKSIKENLRREIVTISEDDKRKKRVVVFGMHEKEDVADSDKVVELLTKLGLEMDVGVSDVFRLRKKGDKSREAPLLIEFDSENDKWKVLKKKVSLKGQEGYERVFLEMDLSLETRMEKAQHFREQKRQREENAQ